MTYLLHILIILGIYVILAVSLNLISGYSGLLSMAHAAFYGIGAYAAALLALNMHTSFFVNLACGVVIAAVIGLLVAWPALRVHDDYFVIASFGFQVIIYSVMNNWIGLTRGPLGLPGIPRPEVFGARIDTHWEFLALTWLLAAVVFIIAWRLVRSPYGRVLKGVREDEVFARALGKHVTYYKLSVFSIGAGLAAVAGALYAVYITFIDPTSFTITESIFLISIIIIGGLGNLWGAVVGAAILVVLPELLRFIGISQTFVANIRQIIYGALLVVMMFVRPQGIIGDYSLGRADQRALRVDAGDDAAAQEVA